MSHRVQAMPERIIVERNRANELPGDGGELSDAGCPRSEAKSVGVLGPDFAGPVELRGQHGDEEFLAGADGGFAAAEIELNPADFTQQADDPPGQSLRVAGCRPRSTLGGFARRAGFVAPALGAGHLAIAAASAARPFLVTAPAATAARTRCPPRLASLPCGLGHPAIPAAVRATILVLPPALAGRATILARALAGGALARVFAGGAGGP